MLSDLSYDTCLYYFYEVIVPSTNVQQHCDRLINVLNPFRMHNLRVKATKYHFGAKSVRFLGHVVSSKGVHTDPQMIDVVSSLSTPVPWNKCALLRAWPATIGVLSPILPLSQPRW